MRLDGLAGDAQLVAARPSYGLAVPSRAWTTKTVETRYYEPYREQVDDRGYFDIYFSLFSMGDFRRYVVESGVGRFSRFRLGTPPPSRSSIDATVADTGVNRKRWARFARSLSTEQQATLAEVFIREAPSPELSAEFLESLSQEQSALLADVHNRPRKRTRPSWNDDEYSTDYASRWIFQRVIRLGWTPKRFGRFDRMRGHMGSGRESHKAERFGKKYQWIAYHDSLARVADNFHVSRVYAELDPSALCLRPCPGSPNAGSSSRGESKGRWR